MRPLKERHCQFGYAMNFLGISYPAWQLPLKDRSALFTQIYEHEILQLWGSVVGSACFVVALISAFLEVIHPRNMMLVISGSEKLSFYYIIGNERR